MRLPLAACLGISSGPGAESESLRRQLLGGGRAG